MKLESVVVIEFVFAMGDGGSGVEGYSRHKTDANLTDSGRFDGRLGLTWRNRDNISWIVIYSSSLRKMIWSSIL